MPIAIGGDFTRWQKLAGLAVLGLALIVGPHLNEAYIWHPLVIISEGIGIAVLSSAILAFTIERWLRADLSKDIFLTAIGHQLPINYREALKAELIRLSEYKFLCERHVLKVTIQPIDDNCVRAVMAIDRVIRNITSSTVELANQIHIDEWNFAQEHSSIAECQIELVGSNKPTKFAGTKTFPNGSILAETKKIKMGAGECARLNSKSAEIRRPTDEISIVFAAPTLKPTIEVDAPDHFRVEVTFGPDAQSETERYTSRRTLDGTYWPLQRMRIHWWHKVP